MRGVTLGGTEYVIFLLQKALMNLNIAVYTHLELAVLPWAGD